MTEEQRFIEVIKNNEAILYKVSRAYASMEEDVKDLYQEIVYQLWKSFSSFRGDSKLSTWIYRVALNTAFTFQRDRKTNLRLSRQEWQLDYQLHQSTDWDPAVLERFYSVLRMMTPSDKTLIFLYLEGKSYEEMAEITGWSVSNIGTRLNRARKSLKTMLQ